MATPDAQPSPEQENRWMHVTVAAVIAALCAGLYVWTVDFPMAFDDYTYLMDNPFFKDAASFGYPANFAEFANRAAKMGMDPDLTTNFILRPVAYASLHLNYALDGFNPRWFRAVNIIIHAANSILIYALLRLLLRRSPCSIALPRGSAVFIPATAALLFAAHPLATESVTYIIQRFTSMSTLFYLLTLWFYFASLHAASRSGVWMLRTSAVILMVLGMLTKECGFTAPLMAVMIDCLVNGTRLRTAAMRALPLLLCLPIIPALVIATSVAQHLGEFSLTSALNIVNSRTDPTSHWHYLVTQTTVVMAYLQRIFWPAGLNVDPEWPLYRSLFDGPVMIATAVLMSLTAAVGWLWRKHRQDARASLAFVCALWFFVTVSVSSGIVPLPDLTADHRSYLPSIGIFALAACLLDCLRNWRQASAARTLATALTVLFLTALAWTTCARNEVWRSPESLWKDAVAKSPGKFRTWGNLGAAYSLGGKEDEAVRCYRKALKIEPRHGNSMFNLSNSLLKLNKPKEALEVAFSLVGSDKHAAAAPDVGFTLGCSLAGVGRYDDAIAVLADVIAAVPNDAGAHKLLGLIYLQKKQFRFALKHLNRAAKLHPPDKDLLVTIKMAESALMHSVSSPISNAPFRLR